MLWCLFVNHGMSLAIHGFLDSTMVRVKLPDVRKSFAQALSGSNDPQLTQLPMKIVMGKSVRVKITQTGYEAWLTDCSINLHDRLILHKGDSPLTTLALKTKLNNLWPCLGYGGCKFETRFAAVLLLDK